MRQPLGSLHIDPCLAQNQGQLGARQLSASLQRSRNDAITAAEHAGIELQLAIVGRHRCTDAWRRQREHPANVLRDDEMPRGPQHVRAQNRSARHFLLDRFVDSAKHALGQRPFSTGIILRLNSTQRRHHTTGRRKPGSDQMLICQSPSGDFCKRHASAASNRSLRPNSRRSSNMLIVSCTNTAPAERYQIQLSSNPGCRDRITAGIATRTIRTADATSDGTVLPIAWNMLEATKSRPDGTNVNDMMRRYSSPTAITAGSFENIPTSEGATTLQTIAQKSIHTPAISAPLRNVAFTRSACRAPKFCPATGATENPSATTGMNPACTMRIPIPKAACAAAPNGRVSE